MNSVNLRRQRAEIVEQAIELASRDGELTEDETRQLEGWKAEAEAIQKRVEDLEEWEGMAEEIRAMPFETRPDVESAQAHPKKQERKWESFGQFLMAVQRASMPGGYVDPRLMEQRATGLNEGVPSDGGFLVQQDFVSELFNRTYSMGEIVRRCRRFPISSNANGLKMNAVAETSRAAGSRWGGIRGYWKAEGAVKTASAPEFRQITLDLKKLAVRVYATDELLQDAAALESVVSQGASEEIMYMTEDAVVNGTGAGQPLGIMNAVAKVSVAKETNQAATTLVYENVLKMWSRLWARSRPNAVWLINQDVEPELYTMALNVGTGGAPVYLPAAGASAAPYATLFGRPVIPVEYCATLGTSGDIILADFSQYALADKGGIQSAMSMHVNFLYDETVFRFVYRVDGQPLWNAALTPATGSTNTLSPFVVLDTRS